jgi:hypothetical protein
MVTPIKMSASLLKTVQAFFFVVFCAEIPIFNPDLGEPLRHLRWLASGYPLHHLRALFRTSGASFGRYGGSATIPLAKRATRARNSYARIT